VGSDLDEDKVVGAVPGCLGNGDEGIYDGGALEEENIGAQDGSYGSMTVKIVLQRELMADILRTGL
jgi:hypothetical protein